MFSTKKRNRRTRRRPVNTDAIEIAAVLFLAAVIVSLVALTVYL